MPGKSRHSKGKHSHSSKKSKALQRQGTTAAMPHATGTTPEMQKQVAILATSPGLKAATATPAKTATNQYPYITSELRRIAILAGIIIVILIVLSITLS